MSQRAKTGEELLAREGYTFVRGRFAHDELEAEYQKIRYDHITDQWAKFTPLFISILIVAIFVHWLVIAEVPLPTRIGEVVILLGVMSNLGLSRWSFAVRYRPETILIATLAGQAGALLILATNHAAELTTLGIFAILSGGTAPQRRAYQLTSTLAPTVAMIWVLIARDLYQGRYLVFNVGFAFGVLVIALSASMVQDRTERISFLLKHQANEALAKSDSLLLNVLPEKVARTMQENPPANGSLVEHFADATVLFADLVGFTRFTATEAPEKTVAMLSDVFRRFDAIAEQCGIEKIKTIGDAYMAVGGVPEPCADHVQRVAEAALEMREALRKYCALMGHRLELRIGIQRGPVIAGVIGTKKFLYDLWGDTVNTASRLESHGLPGRIQVSAEVARSLAETHELTSRGIIELRGKGPFPAFILKRPKLPVLKTLSGAA